MSTDQRPPTGHLGVHWEIGVVVAFIGVIIAVAATVAFQIRWRRRRRREMLVSVLGRTSRQDVEESRHFDYDLTHAISKPPRAASTPRSSKTALQPEHPSQMPLRYY